ncbi:helix-turn-helix domain-containing protein [Pseudomonas qingdaonensis]|uniref:helix-turn-helix domain-containing protein n=1 Tax=Pseudomonas qingdaonensis TaxID=2056231 RepID=UPI0036A835B2
MLTEIGKFLRKARIDHGWLLKDMAEGVGISAAHLSTIETGKRQITQDLVARLGVYLGLKQGTQEYFELEQAALLSRGQVEIETRGLSAKHQEAALAFSRQFNEMNSSDLDRILQVLNSAHKKGK